MAVVAVLAVESHLTTERGTVMVPDLGEAVWGPLGFVARRHQGWHSTCIPRRALRFEYVNER